MLKMDSHAASPRRAIYELIYEIFVVITSVASITTGILSSEKNDWPDKTIKSLAYTSLALANIAIILHSIYVAYKFYKKNRKYKPKLQKADAEGIGLYIDDVSIGIYNINYSLKKEYAKTTINIKEISLPVNAIVFDNLMNKFINGVDEYNTKHRKVCDPNIKPDKIIPLINSIIYTKRPFWPKFYGESGEIIVERNVRICEKRGQENDIWNSMQNIMLLELLYKNKNSQLIIINKLMITESTSEWCRMLLIYIKNEGSIYLHDKEIFSKDLIRSLWTCKKQYNWIEEPKNQYIFSDIDILELDMKNIQEVSSALKRRNNVIDSIYFHANDIEKIDLLECIKEIIRSNQSIVINITNLMGYNTSWIQYMLDNKSLFNITNSTSPNIFDFVWYDTYANEIDGPFRDNIELLIQLHNSQFHGRNFGFNIFPMTRELKYDLMEELAIHHNNNEYIKKYILLILKMSKNDISLDHIDKKALVQINTIKSQYTYLDESFSISVNP